jgi:hypothetical protein
MSPLTASRRWVGAFANRAVRRPGGRIAGWKALFQGFLDGI